MNEIICITGATSGIGNATARLFAASGYDLIICGRRNKQLEELARELMGQHKVRVFPMNLDVRNQTAVDKAFGELPEEWKAISILVNNAGLAVGMGPLHEGNTDDWNRMIDTNIKGLIFVSRAVIPGMIERKKGHLINIGSIAGKEAYLNGNVYCATKHAVDALTKSLRMELLNYGIKVSQVAPGAVETEFSLVRFKGNEEAARKVYQGYEPLKGEDVAEAIHFIVTRPEHVCINDMLIMPTAQANTVHYHKKLS